MKKSFMVPALALVMVLGFLAVSCAAIDTVPGKLDGTWTGTITQQMVSQANTFTAKKADQTFTFKSVRNESSNPATVETTILSGSYRVTEKATLILVYTGTRVVVYPDGNMITNEVDELMETAYAFTKKNGIETLSLGGSGFFDGIYTKSK